MHRLKDLALTISLLPSRTFATIPDPVAVTGLPSATTTGDLAGIITSVVSKALDFIILIGVVYVIVAGIRLIVSGGDEGQKDTAKKTVIYVIVGIIVILLARIIVGFVNSLF
jgi:hypothetical protein